MNKLSLLRQITEDTDHLAALAHHKQPRELLEKQIAHVIESIGNLEDQYKIRDNDAIIAIGAARGVVGQQRFPLTENQYCFVEGCAQKVRRNYDHLKK